MRVLRYGTLTGKIRLAAKQDYQRHGCGTCEYRVMLAEQEARLGKIYPLGKAGRIIRYDGPLKGKIALDIGYGEDFKTRKLSSVGSFVIGCDVDPYLLRIAQKRSRKLLIQPSFIQCDAKYLPFQDTAFYFVVAFDILEHVPNPERMLKENSRISLDQGVRRASVEAI